MKSSIGFWRTSALVHFPPSFVRCFYLDDFNQDRERKGQSPWMVASQPLGSPDRVFHLILSLQTRHQALAPVVPPCDGRGRGRPGAALFQHGAVGGGSALRLPGFRRRAFWFRSNSALAAAFPLLLPSSPSCSCSCRCRRRRRRRRRRQDAGLGWPQLSRAPRALWLRWGRGLVSGLPGDGPLGFILVRRPWDSFLTAPN